MERKQIAQLLNTFLPEMVGSTELVAEDLTNVVDFGDAVLTHGTDNYIRQLVDQIGKVIVYDRVYRGTAPNIKKDGWEYGSILEKISIDELMTAVENPTWQLTNGVTYDPNVFKGPEGVSVKFYDKGTTFEVDLSITDRQLKESFQGAEQMNAFISMLFNQIDTTLNMATDGLIMRTINGMSAANFLKDYATEEGVFDPTKLATQTTTRCINLLYMYNDKFGKALTVDNCFYDPEFLRYSATVMGMTADRLKSMSTLFNIAGATRFTPTDKLHVVLLSEFEKTAAGYLYSDTYHDAFVRLPKAETVAYWQGSGTGFSFADTSKINTTTKLMGSAEETYQSVEVPGILGVMFDDEACMVAQFDRRVTTQYNAKAEFTNYFYKQDARYLADQSMNFVVFYVG